MTNAGENSLAAEYDPFPLLRQNYNSWTIDSPLNTKSVLNITKAIQLCHQTLTAWKSDGSFAVYDKELSPIYTSAILPGCTLQCGTGLTDNSAMVKYKDAWYIVRVK